MYTHSSWLGTPRPPCVALTIAQYSVSPRPPFIAIYTLHYWGWQYRVKAKLGLTKLKTHTYLRQLLTGIRINP